MNDKIKKTPLEDLLAIKVLQKMLRLEDRIEELETINEEHRKINGELREENNKYKNIVDELEKYIKNEIKKYTDFKAFDYEQCYRIGSEKMGENILNKLKELKGE